MEYKWYTYTELTKEQIYQILQLRADVFVVEQNCAYLDPDGRDQQAHHLLASEDNILVAYLRYFPPVNHQPASFGRIVTSRKIRGQGIAKMLMQKMLEYSKENFGNPKIICSAQYYLKDFYQTFGFSKQGEIYLEDGIDHIAMQTRL